MNQEEKKPESFYKYCPVGAITNKILAAKTPDELIAANEFSLANLLNNKARFSKRREFNDLFDTHINLIIPSRKEIKDIRKSLPTAKRNAVAGNFRGGEAQRIIDDTIQALERLLDNYSFYCVSKIPDSNLMWSHYANNHLGYCIEWDAKHIPAEKVSYMKKPADLHIHDFIRDSFLNAPPETFSNKFWEAMKVKMEEWSYEKEYRYQGSNELMYRNMEHCDQSEITLVSYQPEWIKSIIFGARMTNEVRLHIQSIYHNSVQYMEAVPNKKTGKINIVEYKKCP
ncbi:DUF2971 domain-containing protein [Vibrio fluvialis]|uniref:DUF2971 domain-containing protein n=1 Tax=Vibrio fluvialis TaxID=676 RepID=UPI001405603E|nr:DUF2971 domain-containing protein [Vibrio fluvialis]NHN75606.1 DUF2971 domain-containing protein [Vibrio fluvialis]